VAVTLSALLFLLAALIGGVAVVRGFGLVRDINQHLRQLRELRDTEERAKDE